MLHSIQLMRSLDNMIATTVSTHGEREHYNYHVQHDTMLFDNVGNLITSYTPQNNGRLERLITSMVQRFPTMFDQFYMSFDDPTETSFMVIENNDNGHRVFIATDDNGEYFVHGTGPETSHDALQLGEVIASLMIIHNVATIA